MPDVRLIDANALACEIAGEYFSQKCPSSVLTEQGMEVFNAALDMARIKIHNAPTIDAVPVVHSSWGYRAYRGDARITVSGEAVCRKCHAPFFRIRGHWFKYCPNCGAKMDGGAADGSDA